MPDKIYRQTLSETWEETAHLTIRDRRVAILYNLNTDWCGGFTGEV
jgi:hypothetical protein